MLHEMEIGVLGAVILALDIYAIYCILVRDLSGLNKVVWIALVILFPVIGMAVYFLFFHKRVVEEQDHRR